ncbi:MAG: DUF1501 domain-containing protein [Acidobacteria bacterium]|nr:DUF1501 domain-containing protein [Acidobacteriota bacterium]MBK8812258.1 DUF1501 domain-containing protein [Acidobacteriota bacterium]
MKQNRRDFLIKSGCALSMTALASQMRHFGMMSALAQEAKDAQDGAVPSDYRALVFIQLSGGNDGNNTVIPNHNDASISNYNAYFTARNTQGLALAQATLLPISVPRLGGLTYGLHPALGPQTPATNIVNNGIHELWASNKMAIVVNNGTLVAPMTKTQYQNGSIQKPFQLFSHSDQVSQYQGGRSDTASFTGWGGRISDLRTAPDNPGGLVPMITSISGAQLFTSGQTTLPLAIANAGTSLANVLNPQGYNTTAASQARLLAFNQLRTQDLSSEIVAAASGITNSAMQANAVFQVSQEVTVPFPTTSIGQQLKQVARVIKKRTDLSVNRQIFYCQLGGFDTHNAQLANQNNLLVQLSQAMRSFYEEMVVQGIGDKVTQFTMADFCRTLNPAGSGAIVGSDHAWGNHHFVVGGGIVGADFYGGTRPDGSGNYYPTLTFNGPDDADSGTGARGRWIPTTSVEQYAATLARWYGLPDANMNAVFPKLTNFPTSNLGFMGPA